MTDGPLRLLVACDKFRGSLTAVEANAAILSALEASGLSASAESIPIADGGEGTLAALSGPATRTLRRSVSGPFGEPVATELAIDDTHQRAIIEMAAVAGHETIGSRGYDPDSADSAGVGELILEALSEGARDIVVAVGGSVTVDGGAGALRALGGVLRAADGTVIDRPAGRHLLKGAALDLDTLDPRLAEATVTVAADVDNPLTGTNGAAAVFGPQKGVAASDIDAFDRALGHFAGLVAAATGAPSHAPTPHAGAAGGMLIGLSAAFPTVHAEDGFSLVSRQRDLPTKLAGIDLLVTGEGSLDRQSLAGKGPVAIAAMAQEAGRPAIAFAGRVALPAAELARHNLVAFAIGRAPQALEDALAGGEDALRETAESAFRALALKSRTAPR